MSFNARKFYKNHKKTIVLSVVVVAVLLTVFLASSLSPFQQTEGTITIQVLDTLHQDSSDGEPVDVSDKTDVTVYESPVISDLTDDEIKDLSFDDYEQVGDKAKADAVTVDITDDRFYLGKFEYGGSVLWQALEMPEEGTVLSVYMIRETESIVHVATCDDDLSTTFASTDKTDWTITVQCDAHKGLMCGYLYDDDEYNFIVLAITFDNVPVEGDVDVADYSETKHVVGNVLYCELEGNIYHKGSYSITLSDDVIAGTPNTVSLDVGFGQYDDCNYMN